jgi:sugar/nucleoside kinase (ribokinase family)
LCQLKTRSEVGTGDSAEFGAGFEAGWCESEECEIAICLLHAKSWQVGGVGWARTSPEKAARARIQHASLREDYLNQVQRDFLSRPAA